MKKIVLLLLVLAVVFSCGKKRARKAAEEKVHREYVLDSIKEVNFKTNLDSYSLDAEEASFQFLINTAGIEILDSERYSLARIGAGQTLEYVLNGENYTGMISQTISAIRKEGKYYLPNGAEITNDQSLNLRLVPFGVENLSGPKEYFEILPYVIDHELTIIFVYDWGQILVESPEEYFWYDGDVGGAEIYLFPGPKYAVKFKDSSFYLIGQDGNKWRRREK